MLLFFLKFVAGGTMIGLKRYTAAILTMLLLCFSMLSCSLDGVVSIEGEKMDFSAMSTEELEDFVKLGQYKDLQISCGRESRENAVWGRIISDCETVSYPEKHLYYYIEQFESQYKYYAEEAAISYEEMLKQLDVSDADILREAKALTKKDIAFCLIVKKEGISLTDDEKERYFLKYVDKYVEEYGYTAEYVKANMADNVYGSMLYDKVTEFLIVNNSFTE